MDIIPREAWSQIEPRRIELTTPRRLFLHHSVGGAGVPDRDDDGDSGDDYLRIVERHHIETNGWDDIAYNFAIDPIGLEVYELQGWGREPNAQAGFNEETWAVVIIGDFRSGHRHPDSYPGLLERIAELVAYGQTIGELPDVTLEGHRDAPGSEGNHCPGDNLYEALPTINRLIDGSIGDTMFVAADGRNGWAKTGPVVEYWQHFLRQLDPDYDPGVGGWGDATTSEFAAELAKFSPGPAVIGPGEKLALEGLLIQKAAPAPDGGLSRSEVRAIINDSQIVAPD